MPHVTTPGTTTPRTVPDHPSSLAYRHVDVFAEHPYAGNGLTVVFCQDLDQPAERLRRITEEMRQFETIFVATGDTPGEVFARIFTVEEELPFAGHPVIGAAAALHERVAAGDPSREWRFRLQHGVVPVVSRADGHYYEAAMDQGLATLSAPLPRPIRIQAATRLNLDEQDLASLPLQVASTGLPYLIVPVTGAGISRARIVGDDFDAWLHSLGARFVYVLEPQAREGRTWDNRGAVEDVATGSAAGPAVAYLRAHDLADPRRTTTLVQGTYVGRPSRIAVTVDGAGHLWVGGPVRAVASGLLDALPE